MNHILNTLYHNGYLSDLDTRFSEFLSKLTSDSDIAFILGTALVSRACREGDICLDLSNIPKIQTFNTADHRESMDLPTAGTWYKKMLTNPAVGEPGSKLPLILDHKKRLYLYRYWEYEYLLSKSIRNRIDLNRTMIEHSLLKESIQRIFSETSSIEEIDLQKIASTMAVLKKLSIITGGPGTGKTHTVAKILALLLEQAEYHEWHQFQIYLTAPTGKAASKLGESISQTKNELNCSNKIKKRFPDEANTIHKMLKMLPHQPYFYYNLENKLPADVVVIDEASMIDLPLMSKLFQAIPDQAHIILIGDRDQLASVEAGSTFGDICTYENLNQFSVEFCKKIQEYSGEQLTRNFVKQVSFTGLHDCMIRLVKNYRFNKGSGIGEISYAVNQGDVSTTLDLLKQVNKKTIKRTSFLTLNDLHASLRDRVITGYTRYLNSQTPMDALDRFNNFIILCAIKKGPFGVEAINETAEKILTNEGFIHPEPGKLKSWYRGKPVMIKANDYQTGLFNGDIGIAMPSSKNQPDDLSVFFQGPNGEIRKYSPYQLPDHDTVFAMTVHKSQGSEFDNVLLILPEKAYPLLTRELLYTAITRTRKSIEIFGSQEIIQVAVSRQIKRTSGLHDALNKN